jgi:hypothetical protein
MRSISARSKEEQRVAALACQGMATHAPDMRQALGNAVGKRGQITIEREIREQHMRSLAGILGPSPAQPREPLDIDDAVARGVAEEWRTSVAGASGDDEATFDDGAVVDASVAKPQPRKRRSTK